MKRRQFLSASLGLPALLLALTSGCGSGGGTAPIGGAFSTGGSGNNGGNNSGGGSDALRGAAEGYAFLDASGGVVLLPSVAAGTQAGFVPASGLRAEVVNGPSVTIGASGLVRLDNIPAGLRKLRLSGGAASASLEIPLTVVPDAVLPIGAPTVSRATATQAALQAARAQLGGDALTGADVLATSTPLPAGVAINRAIASDENVARIAQPSWFVYVDLVPSARFGHDTLLVLVDAETGATTVQESDSWPLLNGATFYGLASVNAVSPDAVQVASRAASLPVVIAPPAPSASGAGRAVPGTCRAADPDEAKTHYLIIQGDSRDDFGYDPPKIQSFLSGAPFPPPGQMTFLKTFEQAVEPRVAIVSAFNAVRDAAKTGDTFVLYVTTHGTLQFGNQSLPPELRYKMACEAGQGVNGTATTADGKVYKTNLVDIRELDFGPCKACRIVLLIDTCYSGNWIPILRPQLDVLEKPRDLLVFTAADQIQPAVGLLGNKVVQVGVEEFTVHGGGLFTQSLLVAAQRQKNILVKDAVSTDVMASSFGLAHALTDADNQADINKKALLFPQSPQRYVRALDPDEVCGKGNQNVSIK